MRPLRPFQSHWSQIINTKSLRHTISTTTTPSPPIPLTSSSTRFFSTQKAPTIRAGYALELGENPKSFWRTCHNLPDHYVTPLAETPTESYTVVNDLVPHPIRYRSWGSVLEPQHRPQTQHSHNDFVPQKQKFDSTKQFDAKDEEDHLELVRAAMMTGNLRELMHSLNRAPPEYPIGFGLMVSMVLLYSHYSSGNIGSFNYDAWVDGHFRNVLIRLDEMTKLGERIEGWEKDWESFEDRHSQLANAPHELQPLATRTYIWARDTLFPENYMEASKWKQKRHAINDGVSLQTITGRTLDDLTKSTQYLTPTQETIIKNEPEMEAVFERERERDLALIEVEKLRLKMVEDNHGYPLNQNQTYVLRNQLRQIANQFSDVAEGTGLEYHQGMSEVEYDVFQFRKNKIQEAQERHKALKHDIHPTTGLPKEDPFKRQTDDIARIEQRQRLHQEQLSLLSRAASQQSTDQSQPSNLGESQLTMALRQHQKGSGGDQAQQQEQEQQQQDQKASQGIFSQVGSWFFSSSPTDQPTPRQIELAAREAQRAAQAEAEKIKNDSDRLWKEYSTQGVDRARLEIDLDHDANISGSEYALKMMEKVDRLSDLSPNNPRQRDTRKISSELRDDYRRELYGDVTPSRDTIGSFGTRSQAEDFSLGAKGSTENPFTWLAQRDGQLASEIIDKSISATLQYRSEKDLELDRAKKLQFVKEKNSAMQTGYAPTLDHLVSDPEFVRQQNQDDDHEQRLKGGLFGGWFGGGKK